MKLGSVSLLDAVVQSEVLYQLQFLGQIVSHLQRQIHVEHIVVVVWSGNDQDMSYYLDPDRVVTAMLAKLSKD